MPFPVPLSTYTNNTISVPRFTELDHHCRNSDISVGLSGVKDLVDEAVPPSIDSRTRQRVRNRGSFCKYCGTALRNLCQKMIKMIGSKRVARIWTLKVILHGSVTTGRIFYHLVPGPWVGIVGGEMC